VASPGAGLPCLVRLVQAERKRTWALVSARAEGIPIRTLAAAIGLSPSRVHQIVADADPDALDAALGELRAAGWGPGRSSRPRMSGCLMGKQPLSFGILTFNAEADRRAVRWSGRLCQRRAGRAEHVHRSFHWFFFQLPQLPEQALSADNYAFVDWLWDYWTAPSFTDEEHLTEVKRMLAVPGALEATLGYYRSCSTRPERIRT
jgi:hypothetical protein